MFYLKPTVLIGAFLLAGSVNAGAPDTDGDGIADDVDNCVEVFNPDQRDTNNDGFGNICDPDIDNDGFITNFGDLLILRNLFFTTPASPDWNPDADFNGDNTVNFIDLQIMRSFFFGPPGPIGITFINPAGGSWHDPANWLPPVVPDIRYSARIDLDPGVTVEYSAGDSVVSGVRNTSPLLISGGKLTVEGTAQFNDTLTLDTGTLAFANIIAGSGDIVLPPTRFGWLESVTLGQDITVPNNTELRIRNGITLDNSTITLASTGSRTTLDFETGAQTLGGTGEILFGGTTGNDISDNTIWTNNGAPLTIGPNVTIRTGTAGGELGWGSQDLNMQGTIISELSGRKVRVLGGIATLTGSLQSANGGSFELTLNNNSVLNAPVTVSPGGNLTISGNGWTNALGNTLMVSGGGDMALSGTWSNSAGSTIAVSGGGKLDISGTWGNAAGGTISNDGGEAELDGDFTNAGLISVNNGLLDIGASPNDVWSNTGTINVVNSPVELDGAFTIAGLGTFNTSGDVLFLGQVDNTGLTFNLETSIPGNESLGNGAEVIGGTVAGNPIMVPANFPFTLQGVLLQADVTVANGGQLRVPGGITLDDTTITLASTGSRTLLDFISGVNTLDGIGEVVFGGTAPGDISDNTIWTNNGQLLTLGAGITIRSGTSGGEIGWSAQDLDVQGTIISDLAGRKVRVLGSPITLTGGTFSSANGGSFEFAFAGDTVIDTPIIISPGGNLQVTGNGWSNGAGNTLSVSGGGTMTLGGSWNNAPGATMSTTGGGMMSISGTWDNDTGATISQNGAELELNGDWTNNGLITVTDGLLDIGANENDLWSNNGVITVVNSAVQLDGSFTLAGLGTFNSSGDLLFQGQIDNTGQSIDLGNSLPGNVTVGNGAAILGGTIIGAPLTVAANNLFTLTGVLLSTDITVENGGELSVPGGLTLDNTTVTLASTGGRTQLDFQSGLTTLGGTGEVVFGGSAPSDNSDNTIWTNNGQLLTIGPNITIRSDTSGGEIGWSAQDLDVQGTIISDLAGRTVRMLGSPITLTNGTFTSINGGGFEFTFAGNTVIDTPIVVSPGGNLQVTGSGWSNGAGNSLSVTGGGTMTLGGNWNNAAGATMTTTGGGMMSISGAWVNDPGATISQTGAELELNGDWQNSGQVTLTNGLLDIGANENDLWSNTGTIDVVNSDVELDGAFTIAGLGTFNTTGNVLFQGQVDNTGQTFDLATSIPGTASLGNGAAIIGGTISGSPLTVAASTILRLANVTLSTDVTVLNGGSLQAPGGGLTLDNSTVTLASTGGRTLLDFVSGLNILGGTGEVVFGGTTTIDTSDNTIWTNNGQLLTIGPDVIVRTDTAGGEIGWSAQDLLIQGMVLSNLDGRSIRVLGNPLDIEGTLAAAAGAEIEITGTYTLTSTAMINLEAGGALETEHGRLTLPSASHTANLNGSLNLALVNGYTPAPCDTLGVLTWGSRNGTFTTFNGPDLGGGQSFNLVYDTNVLNLEAPGC